MEGEVELSINKLPKFNPNAKCQKCGDVTVTTTHHAERRVWVSAPLHKHVTVPEHMVRKCARCGYSWKERPLDAQETGQK